jgi:hypothetical protein
LIIDARSVVDAVFYPGAMPDILRNLRAGRTRPIHCPAHGDEADQDRLGAKAP